MKGLEPSRPCEHQLLRLACLPFHHIRAENWEDYSIGQAEAPSEMVTQGEGAWGSDEVCELLGEQLDTEGREIRV